MLSISSGQYMLTTELDELDRRWKWASLKKSFYKNGAEKDYVERDRKDQSQTHRTNLTAGHFATTSAGAKSDTSTSNNSAGNALPNTIR